MFAQANMRLQLPWTSKPAEPAPDIEAVAARAATEAVRTEIARVISNSPSNIAPSLTPNESMYPAYRFREPWTWAIPQDPTRRPKSGTSTDTLRLLADNYDVMRACIQHIKRECAAVPLTLVPMQDTDKSGKTRRDMAECDAFINTRGGLGGVNTLRSEFEGALLDDLMIIGAAAIYYLPSRKGGIYSCVPIDATTIRPRVDAFGWPGPTDNIYEQWVFGSLIRAFTAKEMDFRGSPTNYRTFSPYPASPVEWLLNAVNSAVRADDWNRKWLTDGTQPSAIITLPPEWTPDMVKEFVAFWDSIKQGDAASRQKTAFLPNGSTMINAETRKDQDFQQFELWLLRRVCAIFGVQPASVGFAGEQYKVSQNDSMESTSAFGVGVYLKWLKNFYDDLFQRMGFPNVQSRYIVERAEEATVRAQRNLVLTGAPVKTINEARSDEGQDPIEGGDTLLIPQTMTTLAAVLAGPQADGSAGPNTAADASGPNAPKAPAGGNGPSGQKLASQDTSQAFNDLDGSIKGTNPKTSKKLGKSPTPGPTPAMSGGQGDTLKSKNNRSAQFEQWEHLVCETMAQTGRAYVTPGLVDRSEILPHEVEYIEENLRSAVTAGQVRAAFKIVQRGIYLQRHAQTDLSKAGLLRGWADAPLNKQGKLDAGQCGDYLGGANIQEMRSSDLKRARMTAKIIAKRLGLIIVDRAFSFRDWSVGMFDGRPANDIQNLIADYVVNRPDEDIDAGESFNRFKLRAIPAVQKVMALVENGTVATSCVVTHSSVISVIAAWITAGRKKDLTTYSTIFLTFPIQDSSILWLIYTGSGWTYKLLDPLAQSAQLPASV